MNDQQENQFCTYTTFVDDAGLSYREVGEWLLSGYPDFRGKWTLYISIRTLFAEKILSEVLPILKEYNAAFRLIRDEEWSYFLNTGAVGFEEVGKFISIYTISDKQAVEIADRINPILYDYIGPKVPGSLRIGKNMYAHFTTLMKDVNTDQEFINFSVPRTSGIPFKIPSKYKAEKKKKLYGKYYLKIKTLRPGPKGEIMMAMSFKKFAFKPVVIKEGLHSTLEDAQGRDIKDRLLWQQKVLNTIGDQIPTAKALDYFEMNDDCYLVIEYIDGIFLPGKLDEIKKDILWKNLPNALQQRLLGYYLKITSIIRKIHELGYVHRDIQDNNFIITKEDLVYVIDFELSYCLISNEPHPAYLLGSIGYVAPEQVERKIPAVEVDIYSLGALLAFIITGVHPSLYPKAPGELKAYLLMHTESFLLIHIIMDCLESSPETRPDIDTLENKVLMYINGLSVGSEENYSSKSIIV